MHGSLRPLAGGMLMAFGGLLLALPATALEYRPARELGFYGGAIATRSDERVVMYNQTVRATGVLAILPTTIQHTATIFREMARARYGESMWEDQVRSDVTYWEKRHGSFLEKRQEYLATLKAAGITVDAYREIIYRSERYNVWRILGWTRGYSALSLWLLDGQAILGQTSTLIRLQWDDEVYAWGGTHGSPIPSFHLQGAIFVSEAEIGFVEDLAKAMGQPVRFYPELNFSYSLLDSVPAVLEAAKWLRSQP